MDAVCQFKNPESSEHQLFKELMLLKILEIVKEKNKGFDPLTISAEFTATKNEWFATIKACIQRTLFVGAEADIKEGLFKIIKDDTKIKWLTPCTKPNWYHLFFEADYNPMSLLEKFKDEYAER